MGAGHHFLGRSLTPMENHQVHIMTIVVASLSILAAMITIYWFAMIKRSFRQQLILLLIVAELCKSSLYMISSSILLTLPDYLPGTSLCQATGFFLHVGIEACDMGVFFIVVHTALQIFSSTSRFFGQDGLYRYRYAVFVLWVLLPALGASLAFIEPSGQGYTMRTSFCGLPTRPYWSGLLLSWIPRYMLMAYVVITAARIYFYVRTQLKVDPPQDQTKEVVAVSQPQISQYHRDVMRMHNLYEKSGRPTPLPTIYDPSLYTTNVSEYEKDSDEMDISPISPSFGGVGREGRPSVSIRLETPRGRTQSLDDPKSPRTRIIGSMLLSPMDRTVADIWESSDEDRPAVKNHERSGFDQGRGTQGASSATKRKEAILRETRLLFVYPIVYVVGWTLPLISHALSYSVYYVEHPIYALQVLSTFSLAFLPIADCLAFSWREKPWQQIPGSNGTFWGSFTFWNFGKNGPVPQITRSRAPGSEHSTVMTWFDKAPTSPQSSHFACLEPPPVAPRSRLGSFQPLLQRRSPSGVSEYEIHEAQWAHQRLMLERADRRSETYSRKNSAVLNRTHEWWDRRVSDALRISQSEEARTYI